MPGDLSRRRLSSHYLLESRVFRVRRDELETGDGRRFTYDVIEHPGAVVMVPLLAGGHVVLVRQWRNAAGQALLELPAGTREAGEVPEVTAGRELQEEIGYRAERLTFLGAFYSAPGFCSELLHLFLAEGLTPDRLAGDADEAIETVTVPLREALTLAKRGEIRDAKSIAGLFLAAAHLGVNP